MGAAKMNQLGITRAQLAAWAVECGMKLVPDPIIDDEDVDQAAVLARLDDIARMDKLYGTSVVYFIQEDSAGAIKIGTSTKLKKRFDDLARILPSRITLLATTDGGAEVEWVIHRRFDHARIHGEWFRPVPELLAYIETIKAVQK